MAILVDADLILELFLNNSEHTDAFQIIKMILIRLRKDNPLFAYVVYQCLERTCEQQGLEVDVVVNYLLKIPRIEIIKHCEINARQLLTNLTQLNLPHDNGDWDSQIEIGYAVTRYIPIIVTSNSRNFTNLGGHGLQIFSVDRLATQLDIKITPKIIRRFLLWGDDVKKFSFISKKYSWQIFLFLAIMVALAIILSNYILAEKPYCRLIDDNLSCGEEFFLQTQSPSQNQTDAVELYHKRKYQEAAKSFQTFYDNDKNPEALIYLNNSLLEAKYKDYYTVAIPVPFDGNGVDVERSMAREILRGVAQVQTSINKDLFPDELSNIKIFRPLNSINGKGLKIVLANDQNSQDKAKEIANTLIKYDDILGVISHYSSNLTVPVIDIYHNQTVLISSGSTTEDFTSLKTNRDSFLRTIPSVKIQLPPLVDYIKKNITNPKIAIFYNEIEHLKMALYTEIFSYLRNL